jgi:hypothetical protein
MEDKNKKAKKQGNGNGKNGKSEKKDMSRLNLFIVLIAIVVFVAIIIFLFKSLKPAPQPIEVPKLDDVYNGYIFNKTAQFGLWSVVVKTPRGDIPVEFYYHPRELENYSYNTNITKGLAALILRKGNFSIGYDVSLSDKGVAAIAGSEVSKMTGKIFGIPTKSGFVDFVGDKAIPIINCSNSNYMNMVLEFRMGNETKIVYDNKYCIRIYAATLEDTVKLADFMDYKLLGVIPSRIQIANNTINNITGNVSNTSNISLTAK